ncbi:MAG TPA: response regulator [Chthoniobacterales bacterium]|jgi:Response regulator containing CheY-like receiver, AAA-type ATPase, and DNA-binding domains|nr:response regulator [Chthoniobacterales bacterium]
MVAALQRVARFYAVFLIFFCTAVVGLWLYGTEIFSLLLQKSRAYTPPQFLTWLSLASSLCLSVAFCVMPFSLFRIVKKRSDVPFGWIALCIGGFLFLTGVAAFLGLINMWFHGPIVIWTLVLTHLVAALLAVATLLILRTLVPRILEIPTLAQWLAVNKDLMRAEARSEEREKLLAMVSHELRTPLAPLLATLTELDHRVASFSDPEVHDCIQVLRKNIHKEAGLVTDLLSRLEVQSHEAPTAPDSSSSNGERPLRLLLVEDHDDTLRAFSRILRREGFEVQEARTFSEAVAAAREGDFLLSDIALPDGNGCDLMRHLSPLGIPGIAISGYGTAKDRERYKKAGFAESFIKPVDVKQVIGVIGRVMASAHQAAS